MTTTKFEVATYELDGNQKVSTAGQLINRLPNGWTLRSLEYLHSTNKWRAIVEGPTEVVSQ